jgi:hypothetical protein
MKFYIRKLILNFVLKHSKHYDTYIKWSIRFGFIASNYEPLICLNCGRGNDFLRDVPVDYINGEVCEFKVVCDHCKKVSGYWAYGHYQP